jgi:hypothetical protein
MEPPAEVKNKDSWRKNCRRLVARAKEFIRGEIGVAEASHQIGKYQTPLRAQIDADFMVFKALFAEISRLPTEEAVRQHWAPEALEKQDVKIRAIEAKFRDSALAAAHNLIKKYGAAPKRPPELS